jgi:hypothetical protein
VMMRMRVASHHVRVVDRDDVRCAALLNCRYIRVLVSYVDEKTNSGQSSGTSGLRAMRFRCLRCVSRVLSTLRMCVCLLPLTCQGCEGP